MTYRFAPRMRSARKSTCTKHRGLNVNVVAPSQRMRNTRTLCTIRRRWNRIRATVIVICWSKKWNWWTMTIPIMTLRMITSRICFTNWASSTIKMTLWVTASIMNMTRRSGNRRAIPCCKTWLKRNSGMQPIEMFSERVGVPVLLGSTMGIRSRIRHDFISSASQFTSCQCVGEYSVWDSRYGIED